MSKDRNCPVLLRGWPEEDFELLLTDVRGVLFLLTDLFGRLTIPDLLARASARIFLLAASLAALSSFVALSKANFFMGEERVC